MPRSPCRTRSRAGLEARTPDIAEPAAPGQGQRPGRLAAAGEPVYAAGGALVPPVGAARPTTCPTWCRRSSRRSPAAWGRTARIGPARRSAAGCARSPATSSATTSAAAHAGRGGSRGPRPAPGLARRRRSRPTPRRATPRSPPCIAAPSSRSAASSRSAPGEPSGGSPSRPQPGRGRRRAGPEPQRRPPGQVAGPPPPQGGAGRADRLTPRSPHGATTALKSRHGRG